MTNDRSERRTTPIELLVDSDPDELSSVLESDEIVSSEGGFACGEGGRGVGMRGDASGDRFGGLRGAR